jgi:hypothetical protein
VRHGSGTWAAGFVSGHGFSRLKPCRYTSVAKGFSRWDSLGAQGLKPKPFSRFFGTAEAVP